MGIGDKDTNHEKSNIRLHWLPYVSNVHCQNAISLPYKVELSPEGVATIDIWSSPYLHIFHVREFTISQVMLLSIDIFDYSKILPCVELKFVIISLLTVVPRFDTDSALCTLYYNSSSDVQTH